MTIPSIYDVAQDVNQVVERLKALEATHKGVLNELIDRIKVLEADRDRLHKWIVKESYGWMDIKDIFEYESLSSTILDEVTNNVRIDGPVSGLGLTS